MQKSLAILVVLLISLAVGCSHLKSIRKTGILAQRASMAKSLNADEQKELLMVRTKEQTKKAWLHAHEMPSGDYFAGAWVYLLMERTRWAYPIKKRGGRQ